MGLKVSEIAFMEPKEAFERIRKGVCFLLDSSLSGRYSIMGANPSITLKSRGSEVFLEGEINARITADPLDILQMILKRFGVPISDERIPFLGGAVGFFSYDLKDCIYGSCREGVDDLGMYDLHLGIYENLLIFDNIDKKAYHIGSEEDHEKVMERLSVEAVFDEGFVVGQISSNFEKGAYLDSVEKVKRYIFEGDIYQANLSQRFEMDFAGNGFGLFKRLAEINPSEYSAYLYFDDYEIISSSPERFLSVRGRDVKTMPIKGTRPRSDDAGKDEMLADELMKSEKDEAEHLMIVDLERNDLGRICEFGSVKVSSYKELHSFATVHHLISTVEGVLQEDVDVKGILRATFPGGSITGAPKVRSMEIIADLEPTKRGVYTGSIGYIGLTGDMDLNIVIRTIILKGGRAYLQVGGGIVSDSDPEAEYVETLDKAKALFEALENG